MINPDFYKEGNLYRNLTTLLHYPVKERTKVVSTVTYVVKEGDTLYSIAGAWFGRDSQYRWTIIADINRPCLPDELILGETILLPLVILQDELPDTIYDSTKPSQTIQI